jgi:hypothetical protein
MSTRGVAAAETDNASAPASTQLQAGAHAIVAVPSSSALSGESNEPPAVFAGALEASHEGVPPAVQMDAASEATKPQRKGKGVGKRLTDRQRVEILELMEKSGGSLSNAEIARRYGITRAAIQKLKAKGAEVRARYRYGSAATRDNRKRGALVMSVPFERELFEWVRGLKARKVPVPPSLVKEKAKLLVPKYGLGNFQASNGWYYNFCKRFNLTTGLLVEEKPPTLTSTEAPAAMAEDDVDTSLDAEESSPLHQMTITSLTQQVYEQQLQYQQHMAAIAAVSVQEQMQQQPPQQQEHGQQDTGRGNQSKSDRMLALLEQQNTLLERQNSMLEDQAKAIKKMLAVVTKEAAL